MKYLTTDIRPVFPEERLLMEVLLGKEPNEYLEKSVWAINSRYYIDGKSINDLSPKTPGFKVGGMYVRAKISLFCFLS